MYFRVRPELDYQVEIAVYCLINDLEPPPNYSEKIVGVVKMVEIDESYVDEIVNSKPEQYIPFTNFLRGLC